MLSVIFDYVIHSNDYAPLPIMLALGIFAYATTNLWSALAFAFMLTNQFIETLLFKGQGISGYSLDAFPSFILLLAMPALFGATLRIDEERSAMLRTRERLADEAATLRRRTRLANTIHDAVTSDLSSAALLAQRRIRLLQSASETSETDADDHGPSNDPERSSEQTVLAQEDLEAWQRSNTYILSALDGIHAVIDSLQDAAEQSRHVTDGDDGRTESGATFEHLLQHILHDGDQRLRRLGFAGEGRLIVIEAPETIREDVLDCAIASIRELYANIARHGDAGGGFTLIASLQRSRFDIYETNRTTEAAREGHNLPGGHGLAGVRRDVERLDGQVKTSCSDGIWKFTAVIPLP